jgi:SAM-dependent methyltransferase
MTMDAGQKGDALAGRAIHEEWVSTYRTPEALRFYDVAFDELVRRLNPPPDATILDAGCGSCAKSVLLAERGFRVVATDFSATALELGAQVVASRGLTDRVTLRQGNLLELPFADGEFRYALCWGVIMHVPHVQQALSELARVLAPNGTLILSEVNMYSAQAVGLRSLKKVLGKGRGRVVRVPAGLETSEETPQGMLLTRQTDMSWLVAELDRLGLTLRSRTAGQLTELYALAPWKPVRTVIHALNHVWFRHVRLAAPAFANLLIFEKRA